MNAEQARMKADRYNSYDQISARKRERLNKLLERCLDQINVAASEGLYETRLLETYARLFCVTDAEYETLSSWLALRGFKMSRSFWRGFRASW